MRVRQTLDLPEKPSTPNVLPWVERCILSLRIHDVGLAIPLTDVEVEAPWFGHDLIAAQRQRPAFLFSTPAVVFATSKATAGIAKVANVSVQFVPAFDQARREDFDGLRHPARNRLLFPAADVQVVTVRRDASSLSSISIQARMSGAEMDLDADIVNYVFSLIDLYEIGYQRLSKHALDADKASIDLAPPADIPAFIQKTGFNASFVVDSGIIKFHTLESRTTKVEEPNGNPIPKRRGGHHRTDSLSDVNFAGIGAFRAKLPAADVFHLPKFSLWATKHESTEPECGTSLHLDSIMHSSRNTLYPSLLPFMLQTSAAFKTRLQRVPVQRESIAGEVMTTESGTETTARANDCPKPSALRNLHITWSLRIDSSRLEISCLPAAQVSAILDWTSGGLLIGLQPGTRRMDVMVRVDQVEFELRHAL